MEPDGMEAQGDGAIEQRARVVFHKPHEPICSSRAGKTAAGEVEEGRLPVEDGTGRQATAGRGREESAVGEEERRGEVGEKSGWEVSAEIRLRGR